MFTSFWDVGIAVGAPASGLIASLTNYADIYYVMAVCSVGSALLAAPELVRRHRLAAEPLAVAQEQDSPAGRRAPRS